MPTMIDLSRVREAKDLVQAQIEEQTRSFEERVLAPLRAKLADLEAVERIAPTLIDLGWTATAPVSPATTEKPALRTEWVRKPAAHKKPDDVPPMPEMIVATLQYARDKGLNGLTPHGILDYIRHRWWAQARPNDVGPIVWRMAVKENRLARDGSFYRLPEMQKEAAE